ncbi:hypothetical protein FPRO04_14249 [Fusarium proliferatum]|uniref:Ubiquitin-like protease family profile domain-containing protein n=1 Tax=Fusarium oxysporum TaxID=5507 RepID=A0A420M8F6_FUSOX|nr:hypothetical protein FPRO04_14249 [Fusarium proliferatum]RKK58746.1 hypothetical protein BFJ69_g17373 [Fusarium oxysporum]
MPVTPPPTSPTSVPPPNQTPAPTSALTSALTSTSTSTPTPAPTLAPTLTWPSASMSTQKQGLVQPARNWYTNPIKDELLAVDQVDFMNKHWPNGQTGWAKQPFIQTFPPSKRIVNQLHSITVLCFCYEIDLQSLYEPDGYIYEAVEPGRPLGQTNCGEALKRIKKDTGFQGLVKRSILHGKQGGKFDNDIFGVDPEEAAEAEHSDDLPTIDNMAAEAKFKRPLENASIPKSNKQQRSKRTTPPQGSSAAESFDLTQEDSDHDSQSAASHLHPIEDEDRAKQKLSDPTAWLCDESIDRSIRQILLYQNPSNFAWRHPLWLDVQGVNDEGKTLRGKFPKDSRIVFVPVKTALPFKHWSLVVIYQENGRCVKAEHHDSLATLSRTQSIEKALKEVLGDTKLLLIDDFKQRDGYNCGVFVISAIERIVMGKQIPQDLDLAKERQKWRDRLPPSPFLNRETSLSHELSTLEPPNHQSLVSGTHFLEPASSSDNPPLAKDEILEQIQRVKENIQGKQNALSKMQNRETFRTEFGSIMASARRSAEVGDFWDGKEEQKRFLDAIEVVCKLQERFEPQVFRGESKTQVDQDIKDLKVQMKDLHQERVAMVLKEAQEAEAKARDLKLALQEAKKAQKEDTTEREEAQHDADHTAAQLEKAGRDHSSNAG